MPVCQLLGLLSVPSDYSAKSLGFEATEIRI